MRHLPFLFIAFPTVAFAQPQPEAKDGKVVIALTLSPAEAKKPLSRYFLTPQYIDMQPGNKVPGFMKSYMEMDHFFGKEQTEKRAKWDDLKLADLPIEEMKNHVGIVGGLAYRDPKKNPWESYGGRPLSDVDEAARLLSADWQVWFGIRRDGIGLLLPEIQKMRPLAHVLKQRMRYEVRTGDFEKAAYSARTFHGMAKSFEEHPTLIASLVGMAIEMTCINALEEMVAQPGCPNLYWSFVEMPAEVLSLRLALQGEKTLSKSLFPGFLVTGTPMSPEDIARETAKLQSVFKLVAEGNKAPVMAELRYAALAADEKSLAAARAYLVETGFKEEDVKMFPPLQAIVAADVKRYEALLDEAFVIMNLPFREAKPRLTEFDRNLAESKDTIIARHLLPAVTKVHEASARLQQRVAYLRIIEAIRLHAHENKGTLPEKLADIKLPLPLDPVTGKDFEYSVKDGVATLHGGNPSGTVATHNRYYELRLR